MVRLRLIVMTIAVAAVAGLVWLFTPPPADEVAALAASGGLAERRGPQLDLRLASGALLTLTDRQRCGDLPCPAEIAVHYRYLGWDGAAGGYRLLVSIGGSAREMVVPWSGGEAVLEDAAHAASGSPLAQPAVPATAPAALAGVPAELTRWRAEIEAARSATEAPAMTAQRDATRGPAGLRLVQADGRALVLADDVICGQVACPARVFRAFEYLGSSPDGRFRVVSEHFGEGSATLLASANRGTVVELAGPPLFSPDGRRAAAGQEDLERAQPRRLEVWSLAGTRPALEFALPATAQDDTVYRPVAWEDNEHLLLRRGPWASGRRFEAMLSHDGNGWHLTGGGN